METTTFTVKGMTCDHCVAAVTQELSALPGVHDVSIDLASGGVAVSSDAPLSDEAVRDAVDEAGYEVVP
jgi:copper ion binding protein